MERRDAQYILYIFVLLDIGGLFVPFKPIYFNLCMFKSYTLSVRITIVKYDWQLACS